MVILMKNIFRKYIGYLLLCLFIIVSGCGYNLDSFEDETTGIPSETILEQPDYPRIPSNEGEIQYTIDKKDFVFDGYYLGSNQEGVFYYNNLEQFEVWYQEYGQEKAKCVFTAPKANYLVSSLMCDRGIILEINPGTYTEEWFLCDDTNNAKMLFRKDEMRLPEISVYKDWLYVSYTLQKAGKSVLYKINLDNMSSESIYETSIKYDNMGRANGERIVFSGGSEECLYFQILGLKDQYDEECTDITLYRYSDGKVEFVMNPDDILVTMTGVNNKLLTADYATDEPWRETCKIYDTDCNELLGVVEGITPGADIRKAVVYERYLLFTNYYNIYIYDTELNKLETMEVEGEHTQIDIFENKFSYYDFDSKCVCIVSVL
ncbi:MAG: hypothetical protein ACI4AQ_01480 [Lachnospiraceae bacterium]